MELTKSKNDIIKHIFSLANEFKEKFNQEELHRHIETKHYFIDGVYVRSVRVPAGMIIIGKIHNFESIGALIEGRMKLFNNNNMEVVNAPFIQVSPEGIKRVGLAETDCTFISIHKTSKNNIEEAENELISNSYEEYLQKRLSLED